MGVYLRGVTMRRNKSMLILTSIGLILAILLVGVAFAPSAENDRQASENSALPVAALHSPAEPAGDPFFTFGEPDDYIIFLDQVSAGAAGGTGYTLVSQGTLTNFELNQSPPKVIQCTHVRAHHAVPAAGDVISFTDFTQTTPLWQRLARQLRLLAEEPFAITLGTLQPRSISKPVLMSMEDAIAQGLCTRLIDKDV